MFLLRHGQSYFNLIFSETRRDPGIADPELTPLGREQAQQASARLAGETLTRVIISPYTRALQTAEPILAVHGIRAEIMHEVRERAAFSCDIGRHPDELAARFPQHEFGHLPAKWWPDGIETAEETISRADTFRRFMAEQADSATTLLVSHWAFILALTGVSVTNGEVVAYDPATKAPERIVWRP